MPSILRDLALLALTSSAAVLAAPSCNENVKIQVSATALNKVLPTNLNISSLTIDDRDQFQSELSSAPSKEVSGTYTIAARYCEPEKNVPSRKNTLQMLVHGVTYDRNYWSGLGPPGQQFNGTAYSWIDYASKQGYPTLSVDRICNGQSSKPNGLAVCQVPMNAEVLSQVIAAARAGKVAGRKFEKIVFVGHSEGSYIGNELAQLHPSDVDTYILTAYSPLLILGAFGTFLAGRLLPAGLIDPARFGSLALDPSYLITTSRSGTTGFFYFGRFRQEVSNRDYDTRMTVPLGEFATGLLGTLPAPGFKGNLLALSGENDQISCARNPVDPLFGYRGDCGTGDSSYIAQTGKLYPNAKDFAYKIVPSTGHDLNYHYSAHETFKAAHDYLAKIGY